MRYTELREEYDELRNELKSIDYAKNLINFYNQN